MSPAQLRQRLGRGVLRQDVVALRDKSRADPAGRVVTTRGKVFDRAQRHGDVVTTWSTDLELSADVRLTTRRDSLGVTFDFGSAGSVQGLAARTPDGSPSRPESKGRCVTGRERRVSTRACHAAGETQ